MISYILGACFLLLPFITFKQSYDAFEYPKVILFVILMNMIMAVKFWPLVRGAKKYFKLNLIDKLLLLLTVLLLISWGVNGFPGVSFWGQYYRYEGLITLWSYLVFYFLISRLAKTEIIHGFIVAGGIVSSVYVAISGVLFQVFHRPVYTFNGRAAATFGNPNFAAGFLSLSFPYLLFHPKIRPVFKIIMTPFFLLALILTQSRSGLLAFSVVLMLLLIKKFKYGLVVTIPILIVTAGIIFKIIPRYSPFNNQVVVWQKSILAIKQKPLFGWGVERFDIAFQKSLVPSKDFDLYHIRVDKAHNEVLEYGVSGGITTMVVYLFLLGVCLINLYKKRHMWWAWTNLSALVAYFVLSQLNVLNITEYIFFYFILAAVGRISNDKEGNQNLIENIKKIK